MIPEAIGVVRGTSVVETDADPLKCLSGGAVGVGTSMARDFR